MLQKNQTATIQITGLTSEGNGVGHLGEERFAVFVPNTAPGDVAEIKIVKVLKSYAFGRLEKLLTPSPDRIESQCPISHLCGGCSLRHLSYEAECRIKNGWVQDCLSRLGDIHLPLEPFSPSPAQNRYRNKAQYPIGQDADGNYHLGFYANRSHRIIDAQDCLLQPEIFSQIAACVREFLVQSKLPAYDETTKKGLVRHLYLRRGETTGEILVCLVINGKQLPHHQALVQRLTQAFPQIVGIVLNLNTKPGNTILGQKCVTLWGKDTIRDILCGVEVELSPLSFYQVNHDSAENLYGIAAEFAALTGTETLLDLFCGAGTIGLSMARRCKKLIGVEIVPQAVENAKKNAARSGIANAEFFCADAGEAASRLAEQGIRPDVVVLDPPRKGCDQQVIDAVVSMSPSRVVMVSCNPATMARDCKEFQRQGYFVQQVKGVDMFPRTGHVETVCLLSKLNVKEHIEVELDMDELDLTTAESKATYEEIREYVLEHTGLKVSHLYIAQVKQKYGIIERENYNKPKSENSRQPKCPPEKEAAITDALKFFGMV